MLEHLGAHVVRRSHKRGGHVGRAHQDARDTKVTDLDHVVTQEDIPTKQKVKDNTDGNMCVILVRSLGKIVIKCLLSY